MPKKAERKKVRGNSERPIQQKVGIRALQKDILSLSGSTLLNRLLKHDNPEEVVRQLPAEDFYWMIKKVGMEDSAIILKLASEEQWQYLLDLEIWDKDLINHDKTLSWLSCLGDADPERLADWILSEGGTLFSLLLVRRAHVIIVDDDAEAVIPEGYFTLDGRYYIRSIKDDDQQRIEYLLSLLAHKNHIGYQKFLLALASVIPAESEEELYRMRNSRLAEYGFVPYEEALAVYAPMEPHELQRESSSVLPGRLTSTEEATSVPVLPLAHIRGKTLLTKAIQKIEDSLIVDRLRLEFSNLCNSLIAADGFKVEDREILSFYCQRASGYLNIALEFLSKDEDEAALLLKIHNIISLFRVGYGFAVKLQREIKNWRRESWFHNMGWNIDFWGKPWEETLNGLLAIRPLFYTIEKNKELHRDFQSKEEIDSARHRCRQIQALDKLLSRMTLSITQSEARKLYRTFYPLIFNRWARSILGKKAKEDPLSIEEAQQFFRIVRKGQSAPPYRMDEFREHFITALMEGAYEYSEMEKNSLKDALNFIWNIFCEEYENIREEHLDSRYSPYLLIASSK
ncbi:MAG: DUF6178 family protein [Syntrophales bacterium]|nr:DUF6178 family protein [Syntrophales bacterium]